MSARTILVVDDETTVQLYVGELLEDAGFTVLTAADGLEARQIIGAHELGVAIVDKNLPGDLNGLDILRELRAANPLTRVMMHTGYSSTGSAIEALQHGAFDYLEKPIDNDLMLEKVKRAWTSYVEAVERRELFRTYETLFEVIPGLVWFMTCDGEIQRISDQGARMLGYSPDELVGESYVTLLDHVDATPATHWAFKERRRGERATRNTSVKLRTKGGLPRIFEVSSAAAYERGRDGELGQRGTIGVGWDITEHLSLLEEAQQTAKMDSLGRLAGGVAHDLNNLLGVITNSVDFIRDEQPGVNEQTLADLKEIEAAAERAAEMTKQLLVFSRHEVVEPEPVDVKTVLQAARRMLSRLIRKDIALEVEIDPNVGHVLLGKGQLDQILVNLAVNARDAMPDGGMLRIAAAPTRVDAEFCADLPNVHPGDYVLFSVTDSGTGMEPLVRQQMFEPFFTTKEAGKGTGLGTSIVYGIVRHARGFISVYSELDLGTTVRVYLPSEDSGVEAQPVVRDRLPFAGSETILLVEDEDTVRRVARRVLERAGYRVLEARSGEGGIAAWQANNDIDLLLTDVMMPGMGGPELARRLRALRPDLPIVYVSGYLGEFEGSKALLLERSTFVPKPYTAEALLRTVRGLLDSD